MIQVNVRFVVCSRCNINLPLLPGARVHVRSKCSGSVLDVALLRGEMQVAGCPDARAGFPRELSERKSNTKYRIRPEMASSGQMPRDGQDVEPKNARFFKTPQTCLLHRCISLLHRQIHSASLTAARSRALRMKYLVRLETVLACVRARCQVPCMPRWWH